MAYSCDIAQKAGEHRRIMELCESHSVISSWEISMNRKGCSGGESLQRADAGLQEAAPEKKHMRVMMVPVKLHMKTVIICVFRYN